MVPRTVSRLRAPLCSGSCCCCGGSIAVPASASRPSGSRSSANRWRLLFIAACVSSALPCSSASSSPSFPRKYDREIRQAAELYLPGLPWRLYKAQLYQESRLDPLARSPAGAEGIAQFMPATWGDMQRQLRLGAPRTAAGPAIAAGAYYMAQLRRRWRAAAEWDRHRLAAASYNAGAGNIARAVAACGDRLAWSIAADCLDEITGRHARETTTYVERIWKWWAMMEAGL